MATTRVTRDALQAGDLPSVCVVTGDHADGLVQSTLRHTPAWPWALLLLVPVVGDAAPLVVLAMVVAFFVTTERIPARLPMTSTALARHHRARRRTTAAAAVGIALIVLAVVLQGDLRSPVVSWLVGAGVLPLVVAAVGRLWIASGFVHAVPARDGVHLTLRHVPVRFAEAVADDLPVTVR